MTLTGETVAIVTLLAGPVRPLNRRALARTRELQAAQLLPSCRYSFDPTEAGGSFYQHDQSAADRGRP